MTTDYQDIIDFWFSERVRKNWWSKDEAFDQEIQTRFAAVQQQAAAADQALTPQQPGSSF